MGITQTQHPPHHNGKMIRHTVLFRYDDPDIAPEIKNQLESLVGRVPGLKSMWVGVSGSEASTHHLVLVTEHDGWEALATYASHPAHTALIATFANHIEDRSAIDVEL